MFRHQFTFDHEPRLDRDPVLLVALFRSDPSSPRPGSSSGAAARIRVSPPRRPLPGAHIEPDDHTPKEDPSRAGSRPLAHSLDRYDLGSEAPSGDLLLGVSMFRLSSVVTQCGRQVVVPFSAKHGRKLHRFLFFVSCLAFTMCSFDELQTQKAIRSYDLPVLLGLDHQHQQPHQQPHRISSAEPHLWIMAQPFPPCHISPSDPHSIAYQVLRFPVVTFLSFLCFLGFVLMLVSSPVIRMDPGGLPLL